jgi:hypothetical protein
MPYTSKNTAEAQDFGLAVERRAELEDITVGIVSIRETHSLKDALAGLPGGICQCPHWGYVFSGAVTCDYGDREETYRAGDAFYMTPGHVPTAEAGSEFVLFSPKDQLAATEAAIHAHMRSFAAGLTPESPAPERAGLSNDVSVSAAPGGAATAFADVAGTGWAHLHAAGQAERRVGRGALLRLDQLRG